MSLLKRCEKCGYMNLMLLGEAGHTRMYYCNNCGETTTQYVKKEIKCRHRYDKDDTCQYCNYERKKKYT